MGNILSGLWWDATAESEPEQEPPSVHEQLFEAAAVGNLEKFQSLFSENDQDISDENKNTLLHVVCREGRYEIAMLLKEADCLKCNADGCVPLHLAAKGGHTKCVELLRDRSGFESTVNMRASQGLTPLHAAAAEGCSDIVSMLLLSGADPNVADARNYTPLSMAACNGFVDIVQDLLAHGARTSLAQHEGETCLYLAARNGHTTICELLIEAFIAQSEGSLSWTSFAESRSGYTPLHGCAMSGSERIASALLSAGADVNVVAADGSTALQTLGRSGHAALAPLLLSAGADPLVCSSFGETVLHVAAGRSDAAVVRSVVEAISDDAVLSKLLAFQDNDGLTPLHCAASGTSRDTASTESIAALVTSMVVAGADVNAADYNGSTALHIACWEPVHESAVEFTRLLIAAGADPTIEDDLGWSVFHVADNRIADTGGSYSAVISSVLAESPSSATFLASYDKDKPRSLDNSRYCARRGPHNRIPIAERDAVLDGDVSLGGIAKKILSFEETHGRKMKIVVMTGAGISVSSGIPDFRSKTGLYGSGSYGSFDNETFFNHPDQFWSTIRKVFLPAVVGDIKPTATHRFMRLLHDRGLLARWYTQNIDTLERAVGIPKEKLVEAHGTFSEAYCTNQACSIREQDVAASVWTELQAGDCIPRCAECDSLVKPAVVQFGEPLPERFHTLRHTDFKDCDMVIVMGTSLVVYPFAGLLNDVPLLSIRLLINREARGPFVHVDVEGNYRDVACVGDCDDGVRELARLLKWEKDLDQLAGREQE